MLLGRTRSSAWAGAADSNASAAAAQTATMRAARAIARQRNDPRVRCRRSGAEVPAYHRRDVGDGPRPVVVGSRYPAEGQRAQRVDAVQRAVAAAADMVDPTPVGELVAG